MKMTDKAVADGVGIAVRAGYRFAAVVGYEITYLELESGAAAHRVWELLKNMGHNVTEPDFGVRRIS